MTISDVLEAAGWPVGRGRRTKCPIHRGDNPQAFSFTDEVYKCHVCSAKGNAYTLSKALGLLPEKPPPRPERPVPGVVGFSRRAPEKPVNRSGYTVSPTCPTERLRFALNAKWRDRREEAMLYHDMGWNAQRRAGAVLRGELSTTEDRMGVAADLWLSGQIMIDVAHSVLECECNEALGGGGRNGQQAVVWADGGDVHAGDGRSIRDDRSDHHAVPVLQVAASADRQD